MSIVGAGGGFANPNLPQSGFGARIDAVQNFTQGDKLIMVVGQQGLVQSNNNATFFSVVSSQSMWSRIARPCARNPQRSHHPDHVRSKTYHFMAKLAHQL